MKGRKEETPENRRLARRHVLKVPIRFRLRRAYGETEQKGESENVSRRGVFFHTALQVSENAPVDLVVEMPEEITGVPSAQWLCTGRVVRVEPTNAPEGDVGVAVQIDFYQVSRGDKSSWTPSVGIRGPVTP
jgi:hypothetical protein